MRRIDSSSASISKAAPIFAALGDPIRLAMLARLSAGGPLATIQLGEREGVSRQAITKHLLVLEDAGLVCSDRVGRDRQWRVQARQIAIARSYLDQVSREWDGRLDRLKAYVEGR